MGILSKLKKLIFITDKNPICYEITMDYLRKKGCFIIVRKKHDDVNNTTVLNFYLADNKKDILYLLDEYTDADDYLLSSVSFNDDIKIGLSNIEGYLKNTCPFIKDHAKSIIGFSKYVNEDIVIQDIIVYYIDFKEEKPFELWNFNDLHKIIS